MRRLRCDFFIGVLVLMASGLAMASFDDVSRHREIGYLASDLILCAEVANEKSDVLTLPYLDIQEELSDKARGFDGSITKEFFDGMQASLADFAGFAQKYGGDAEVAKRRRFNREYCARSMDEARKVIRKY